MFQGANRAGSTYASPTTAMRTSGTIFSSVVTICTVAGLLHAAHVHQREQPDPGQRNAQAEQRVLRPLGKEVADIAGERHGDAGIAGPQRDPVPPRDQEAGKLPEAGPRIGVGAAGRRYQACEAPEHDREDDRTGAGHDPAERRDRPVCRQRRRAAGRRPSRSCCPRPAPCTRADRARHCALVSRPAQCRSRWKTSMRLSAATTPRSSELRQGVSVFRCGAGRLPERLPRHQASAMAVSARFAYRDRTLRAAHAE